MLDAGSVRSNQEEIGSNICGAMRPIEKIVMFAYRLFLPKRLSRLHSHAH